MRNTRIRTKAQARRYVCRSVATMLMADFDNASEWMHAAQPGFNGNLQGMKSEQLVHEAARELARQLEKFSKGRT